MGIVGGWSGLGELLLDSRPCVLNDQIDFCVVSAPTAV